MFHAISESLPIAFGILVATLPLMTVPLTLVSRGAIGVLGWFLAGYAGGFVLLGGAVIAMADLFVFASGDAWGWWSSFARGRWLTALALA